MIGAWRLWASAVALFALAGCPRPAAPAPDPPRVRAPAPPAELRVRFFAAGHGDAILLSLADGHHALVDAGRAVGGDHLVRRRLVPFFRAHHIRRLDAFVVTHPHPDHFGDPVGLRRGVAFTAIHTNADGAALLATLAPGLRGAAGRPVRLVTWAQGDGLQLGALRLQVVSPPRDATPPAQVTSMAAQNDRSLVLRVTFGEVHLLLAADLTASGERQVLATRQPLGAAVLKLGHHGRGSTSDAWLARVRPRFAIATCGDYFGRWQRPDPTVLARLRRHRVRVYRTDRDGDVVVVTDGRHLTVQTHPHLVYRPPGLH